MVECWPGVCKALGSIPDTQHSQTDIQTYTHTTPPPPPTTKQLNEGHKGRLPIDSYLLL